MPEPWFKKSPLDLVLIREEQETLAVCIESSHRVDVRRKRSELGQRSPCTRVSSAGELGKDAVRFIEEDQCGMSHRSPVGSMYEPEESEATSCRPAQRIDSSEENPYLDFETTSAGDS